ncbi:hypothetical protein SAMN05192550_1616 [Flavobacterium glycines]|uniref:Uncharacterized protein n=1 Tax=Flavobacterium glycines TaxID=551990 RepID=A0A1B9DY87_9FLAO|nr:hypothetical protein [Flavobacterium glycines]OCB74637.1 hypothetical protein FBGL_01325 [Flavobacterium glycines]GEL09386.1 hypothetical protein FGL01_01250 [Flavobacterium glycines]SDJ08660.1 hypothetical protein SAMN05192550_1616 [Flavobacterium glycines]
MKEFKLNNIPKIESGFKTPDELYFENFSVNLLNQLPKKEPKTISLFQKKKSIIMMVAAVFVLALAIPSLIKNASKRNELDTITLENYLSYQSNINQYDLINALDEEDIKNIDQDIELKDQTIEDILISNNNIEHYIIE